MNYLLTLLRSCAATRSAYLGDRFAIPGPSGRSCIVRVRSQVTTEVTAATGQTDRRSQPAEAAFHWEAEITAEVTAVAGSPARPPNRQHELASQPNRQREPAACPRLSNQPKLPASPPNRQEPASPSNRQEPASPPNPQAAPTV